MVMAPVLHYFYVLAAVGLILFNPAKGFSLIPQKEGTNTQSMTSPMRLNWHIALLNPW
jgi:hypothetical protein